MFRKVDSKLLTPHIPKPLGIDIKKNCDHQASMTQTESKIENGSKRLRKKCVLVYTFKKKN